MGQENLYRERSTLSTGTKMPCEACGIPIEQRGAWRRRFCNAACRGQAWRQTQILKAALALLENPDELEASVNTKRATQDDPALDLWVRNVRAFGLEDG